MSPPTNRPARLPIRTGTGQTPSLRTLRRRSLGGSLVVRQLSHRRGWACLHERTAMAKLGFTFSDSLLDWRRL